MLTRLAPWWPVTCRLFFYNLLPSTEHKRVAARVAASACLLLVLTLSGLCQANFSLPFTVLLPLTEH